MDPEYEIQLNASLWNSIKELATDEAQALDKTVTNEYIVSLAEVIQGYIETMAIDLEAFANHAKRVVISMDDVKLCARRNERLSDIMKDMADNIQD
ncbi:hypothetical protein K501DRAFT_283360 [Backusella circina FSU 941]|nr:hypothetical protein K501DRAFT_283360 [Backusella circina FSU 941]